MSPFVPQPDAPSPTFQLGTQLPRPGPEHHRSPLSPSPSLSTSVPRPRGLPFRGTPPPRSQRPTRRAQSLLPTSQSVPPAGAGTILQSARWPVPASRRPRLPQGRGLRARLPPSHQHLVLPPTLHARPPPCSRCRTPRSGPAAPRPKRPPAIASFRSLAHNLLLELFGVTLLLPQGEPSPPLRPHCVRAQRPSAQVAQRPAR